MGVRLRKPMRMACADVAVGIAIRRRGLRQPRRITDRAEIDGRHVNVVANRLEPLEDGLPLLPIQLAQKRAQSLDEGILEQSFAVGFRDEEAVQADVERLGYFLRGCRWRNQELQALRQGPHASAAISRARTVLDQTAGLAADDFPIQL